MLPMQGTQVRALVGELRSHVLCSVAKKGKKKMATLWLKAQHEGALPPPCIVRKDPRVPHIREPLVRRQGSQLSMRVARGSASWLSSHGSCDPVDCSQPDSSVHGISRQEYWNGLPFPFPGDFSHSGIEPGSPAL